MVGKRNEKQGGRKQFKSFWFVLFSQLPDIWFELHIWLRFVGLTCLTLAVIQNKMLMEYSV